MRGAALLLTAALIHCQQHALALQCYNCNPVEDGMCMTTSCSGSQAVCYTGTITMNLGLEGSMKLHHKGCLPSCEDTEFPIMTDFNEHFGPEISKLMPDFKLMKPTMKVQVEKCCKEDLCNGAAQGARSLGALAAGLLLSLGVALLCTHL